MKTLSFFIINFFIFTFLLPHIVFAQTSTTDSTLIDLTVTGCNFNGICEEGTESNLNCSSDCKINAGSTGGYPTALVEGLEVSTSTYGATISWRTSVPTFSILRWGTTNDLNDGISRSVILIKDHSLGINSLSPDTIYYLTVENIDALGRSTVLSTSFKTLSLPSDKEPQNPTNFKAILVQEGVLLTWTNPKDFEYVRIMKNIDHMSGSPFTGTLLYEGIGTKTTDLDISEEVHYYYTIFARDESGKYSSGSLAEIFLTKNNTSPDSLIDHYQLKIKISQTNRSLPIVNNTVLANGGLALTIDVSNTKEESEPKFVNVIFPSGREDNYLLVYDPSTRVFRASVPALGAEGRYRLKIMAIENSQKIEMTDLYVRVLYNPSAPRDQVIPLPLDIISLIICLALILLWSRLQRKKK